MTQHTTTGDGQRALTIGKEYGRAVYGLDSDKGQALIYRGGDVWEAVEGDRKTIVTDAKITAQVSAYMTRPAVLVGMPGGRS